MSSRAVRAVVFEDVMQKDVVDHDAAQTEIKVVSAPKARFLSVSHVLFETCPDARPPPHTPPPEAG